MNALNFILHGADGSLSKYRREFYFDDYSSVKTEQKIDIPKDGKCVIYQRGEQEHIFITVNDTIRKDCSAVWQSIAKTINKIAIAVLTTSVLLLGVGVSLSLVPSLQPVGLAVTGVAVLIFLTTFFCLKKSSDARFERLKWEHPILPNIQAEEKETMDSVRGKRLKAELERSLLNEQQKIDNVTLRFEQTKFDIIDLTIRDYLTKRNLILNPVNQKIQNIEEQDQSKAIFLQQEGVNLFNLLKVKIKICETSLKPKDICNRLRTYLEQAPELQQIIDQYEPDKSAKEISGSNQSLSDFKQSVDKRVEEITNGIDEQKKKVEEAQFQLSQVKFAGIKTAVKLYLEKKNKCSEIEKENTENIQINDRAKAMIEKQKEKVKRDDIQLLIAKIEISKGSLAPKEICDTLRSYLEQAPELQQVIDQYEQKS